MADDISLSADAQAAALEAQAAPPDKSWATVIAVNTDGTVTVQGGKGFLVVRCARSYLVRAEGDRVPVLSSPGALWTPGPLGPSVPVSQLATSLNNGAPSGGGWEAVSAVYFNALTNQLWLQRTTPAPPPSGGRVVAAATAVYTYRGGQVTQRDRAEQGDGDGAGIQTGLITFGASAWSGLSGQTPTGGTLRLHRRSDGGYTPGPVTARAWRANYVTPPTGTPTYDGSTFVQGDLAVNETADLPLSAAFCAPYASGGASAVVLFSSYAIDNLEIDSASMTINF